MKKALLIPFILLCVVSFTLPACAMKNELDNFRGIPWRAEDSKNNINRWELLALIQTTVHVTVYMRSEDDLSIGGAEITGPILYFFDDSLGFSMATIRFQGQEQYNLVLKTCNENWGNPDFNRRDKYEEINYDYEEIFWIGEQVYAKLEYNHDFLGTSKTGQGNLSITLKDFLWAVKEREVMKKQKEDGF